MTNPSGPENVVDINSYLANPISSRAKEPVLALDTAQNVADLAQTNKKLVTIVMGMTLMIGLVACIAYLAGRAITLNRAGANQLTIARTEKLPIIVDSPKVSAQKVEAPVAKTSLPPAPVSAPATKAVAPVPLVTPPAPARVESTPDSGTWYVQVGYIETPQSDTFRSALKDKGFKTTVAKGDSPSQVRILVGPVADYNARMALQRQLLAAGYESFQRRY